jgi:molybdopterin synthase catalytic subunit
MKGTAVDINALIEQIKRRPDYGKVGMILCHNGVVRQTSRDGRPVTGLRVKVDHQRLGQVIAEQKKRPGIIDILVQIREDQNLAVGDDVMALVVAGDIRETVIAALTETLNTIKTVVTVKTEFFRQG